MTFAPNPQGALSRSALIRTVVFWVMMLLLAVILWRMASEPAGNDSRAQQMSYSDFLAQVDKSNIATATFRLSQSTAEARGNLRQPVAEYRSNVPRESVAGLTDRLRKQGVTVEVSEVASPSAKDTLINYAPVVLIAIFWIFMMLARTKRRPAPADPANRPLG